MTARTHTFAVLVFLFAAVLAGGAPAGRNRYAVILSRQPAARQFAPMPAARAAAAGYRDAIRAEQAALRRELERRDFR